MKRKFAASFDELLKSYYGRSDEPELTNTQKVESLIANYYGRAVVRGYGQSQRSPAVSLSLCRDDGEVLVQPSTGRRGHPSGRARFSSTRDFVEYVVENDRLAQTSSLDAAPETSPRGNVSPQEEYVVDVRDPLQNNATGAEQPRAEAVPPATPPRPAQPAIAPAPAPPRADSTAEPGKVTEQDFIADMESILTGKKVFDPLTKKTVTKEELGKPAPALAQSEAGKSSAPEAGNTKTIFDRIRENMQLANAYDLGDVELSNRFSDFDRVAEMQEKAAAEKKARSRKAAVEKTATPTVDFIQDLDAIRQQQAIRSAAAAGQPVAATAGRSTPLSVAAAQAPYPFSKPFYDTGEHVLAGGDLYQDRFLVGQPPGVNFSYGQIIAMADLYESVDLMMGASPAELNRLKELISRSTRFYQGRKRDSSLDVDNETWDKNTDGRYLKLADKNYEHFSPALVAGGVAIRTVHGDNRSMWESYHRRAIVEAQKMFLAADSQTSIFFEWPLIINAFGDHFLTDAFAAGHLINKEVMVDGFNTNFYTGGTLNSAGEAFFEKVAKAAWQLENVAARFSKLESVDWAHWHGIPLPFHPNIDSADRFGILLKEAASQDPEGVANLIVKALHDRLNREGVEVTNQAGDGIWILPGDGSMIVGEGRLDASNLAKNLDIIRKAVQQSVDDINSPAIRGSNVDLSSFMDGVWRYVPQLTPASQREVSNLMREYTDPGSAALVTAAAEIIKKQLDSLLKILTEEKHKLKPA
jgi:hypothetical protein